MAKPNHFCWAGGCLGVSDWYSWKSEALGCVWGYLASQSLQYGAVTLFWHSLERPIFFSSDHTETSKYQNVHMSAQQEWLGLAIFQFFKACQRKIIIYSCYWSPCIYTMSSGSGRLVLPYIWLILQRKNGGITCFLSWFKPTNPHARYQRECQWSQMWKYMLSSSSTSKLILYRGGYGGIFTGKIYGANRPQLGVWWRSAKFDIRFWPNDGSIAFVSPLQPGTVPTQNKYAAFDYSGASFLWSNSHELQ